MSRTVIISESMFKKLASLEILNESNLSKTEVADAVKDAIKNDSQVNKEIEKKVKNLVAASVNTLFKTLWQRRNFYEDEIKR